jgi:SAM-dependent methyltransferase
MNINAIINRDTPPAPWAEGEKIPWDDPGFSERMLAEHLSQEHDMASRRAVTIDRHVAWIHETCLGGRPSRILDLGCGPGLYLQRLARLGHDCTGIDFSPASIRHARSQAVKAGLDIRYLQGDVRSTGFGEGFDLAMMVFGEFNVFQRDDARSMLERSHQALAPGGKIILEPQTYDIVEKEGTRPPSWHAESSGLFSEKAHLWLEEHFWHADRHAATVRYFIIDAATGAVQRYASTSQAYTDDDFDLLLTEAGFSRIRRFPSLDGTEENRQEGLFVVAAGKHRADGPDTSDPPAADRADGDG